MIATPMRLRQWLVLLDLLLAVTALEGMSWTVHRLLFTNVPYGEVGSTVHSSSILLFILFGNYAVGLYDRDVLVREGGLAPRVVASVGAATVGGLVLQYFVWYVPNGRITLLAQAVALVVVVLCTRAFARLRLQRAPRRAVAVFGTRKICAAIDETFRAHPHCPVRVSVFVSADRAEDVEGAPPLPAHIEVLGGQEGLSALESRGVETLVMGAGGSLGSDSLSNMTMLQANGLKIRSAAALISEIVGYIPIHLASPNWIVGALEQVDQRTWTPFKRAIDVGLSLVGLGMMLLLSPMLIVLVKFRSPGPLFFSQERVGLGGRTFRIHKLRTMTHVTDADGRWASADTARISPGGWWLRQTRLDEFPQFWNVLRGEMSVVGPRPEQPGIARSLAGSIEFLHYRNMVKPGITGWAQVMQGYVDSEEGSARKLTYDLFYVQNFGFFMDLEIMVKTVFIMLARVGAR